jgi:hypothetical protein
MIQTVPVIIAYNLMLEKEEVCSLHEIECDTIDKKKGNNIE